MAGEAGGVRGDRVESKAATTTANPIPNPATTLNVGGKGMTEHCATLARDLSRLVDPAR